MKRSIALFMLFTGSMAQASYELATSGRRIVCTADDNQSWVLDSARTRIRFTVEGETRGARPIVDTISDGRTYIAFTTDEGTLSLGKKNTWQFAGDREAWEIECKAKDKKPAK